MKLLPVLLGVALLVLIMETGETEGGPRPDSEGGETENKGPGLWEKLKAVGKKYKEKAKIYLHKLITKFEESMA